MNTATLAAMADYLQREALIGGYEAADEAVDQIAAVYASVAELIGASASQIALFDNSTHAWNAAFYSVPLREGDRILTGRNEYGSSVLAYLQAAQRVGAEVVVVPNDDTGQLDVDALADLIDERTKLIGLTWVPTSGSTGSVSAAGLSAPGCAPAWRRPTVSQCTTWAASSAGSSLHE